MPVWCTFRDAARKEQVATEAAATSIAEGQERFWAPGSGSGLELARLGEVVCPERDEENRLRRAGVVRRIALSDH